MNLLEHLNTAQQSAVTSTSKYLRIVAGAGSGKTRVLITRIAYLIAHIGIAPNRIVAITFTNKAAKEMQSRILDLLHDDAAGVHLSTIHSLCVSILRQDINHLNYPRNFTIVDSSDQKSILQEGYKKYQVDTKAWSYGACLDYIGGCKGEKVTPAYALKMAGKNPYEMMKAQIYAFYEQRLRALFALDFDDLLLWSVNLLQTNEQVLAKWQRRFQVILVDEFQDVDRVQYTLVQLLAGEHNEVYVVGDPDQTIYTWRGADVNIIMHFEKDFADAETIYLNQNYRSSANILEGANSLIRCNKFRLEKDLFTNSDAGNKIRYFSAVNEEAEAKFVADTIKQAYKNGQKYKDIAILYRSNYISRVMEKVLLQYHMPYRIFGGMRFYDRMEIKDSLCYLRLICKEDDLSFQRVINSPKRGIGNKTMEVLMQEREKSGRSFVQILREEKSLFSSKIQKEFDHFLSLLDKWKGMSEEVPITKLLETVMIDSGYQKMLNEANEIDRSENIKELLNDIMYFEKNNSEGTLDEYLQMISLFSDKDVYDEGDYLSLMTVHSSKGLEYDTVFVVSMSESVFPNERAMAEGARGLEEERRLAYVAFTRARKQLYISDSQGFSFVLNTVKIPSRFIQELAEDCIEQIGIQPIKRMPMSDPFWEDEQSMAVNRSYDVYKKGDVVVHTVFGEGIVLKLEGDRVSIAFPFPHGVKMLQANHASLSIRQDDE